MLKENQNTRLENMKQKIEWEFKHGEEDMLEVFNISDEDEFEELNQEIAEMTSKNVKKSEVLQKITEMDIPIQQKCLLASTVGEE